MTEVRAILKDMITLGGGDRVIIGDCWFEYVGTFEGRAVLQLRGETDDSLLTRKAQKAVHHPKPGPKQREKDFYEFATRFRRSGKSIREAINHPDCPVMYKQAWYYLDKWSAKGYYDWGVSLDLGWFTKEAPLHL